MPLETDFNISPYFDDYDPNKKFYRVLYRPAVALQARELTQTQSMIQNQIESFAGHIYKDGARIEGCTPTIIPNLYFVRLVDNFIDNPTATVLDIKSDYLLVGQNSRVKASCIVPVEGSILEPDGKTNRLYIRYIDNTPSGATQFISNETILVYNENQDKFGPLDPKNLIYRINVIVATDELPATGKGYGFKIEDGMVYQKGFFQNIAQQTIVVRDFDQNVGNTMIGFNTVEEIITENDDGTLFDNALGYPNENAPGAHRLKLDPVLIAKEVVDVRKDEYFFSVFSFSNVTGDLILDKSGDPYSDIGSFIDKRTFDESGDFVVKPFLASAIPAELNSNNFAWQLSSGKGYVHGTQVEWLAAGKYETSRAFTSRTLKDQILTANFGSFVFVQEFAGFFDTSATNISVDIYNTPQKAVTAYRGAATGNKIGTANIKTYTYNSGQPGTPDAKYKIYITDINMLSGFDFASNAKSFAASVNGNLYMAADLVLNLNNSAVIAQSDKNVLIGSFGRIGMKTLAPEGNWNTTFQFSAQTDTELQPNGYISVTSSGSHPGGDNIIGYGIGRLSDALENQIVVTLKDSVETIQIPGVTVNIRLANTAVKIAEIPFGNIGPYFTPGEYIRINGKQERITRIVNASAAEITNGGGIPAGTNLSFSKWWPAGYKIPLFDNISGGERYANVVSTSSFTICSGVGNNSVQLLVGTTTPKVNVRYKMSRTSAQPLRKAVKKSVLTKLYLENHPNKYAGPWLIGFSDVYSIEAVYASATAFETTSDVTNMFSFDTGQTDYSYETSQLVLKPQFAAALRTTPYIVIKSNIFVPDDSSGIGFYSVDSYPTTTELTNIPNDKIAWAEIPTYSGGNGVRFDLRDSLDFRAVKTNTATVTTDLQSATINPVRSPTFNVTTLEYLIEADTNVISDIEYYLGRRDVIGINTKGKMVVVNGVPNENPKDPLYDVDVMPVAMGYVPPYPSLTPEESAKYKRSDYLIKTRSIYNRGYTMRDIGILDQRIARLEYYTTLNVLEQRAQSLSVKDAQNNDRFKNGIFADPMSSFIFSDTSDTEYRWAIDINRGYGRPMYKLQSVDLAYDKNNSSNIQLTGRCLTLPYTEELIIDQPYATKVRNNAQDAWSFLGQLDLYPNYDTNRDQTILPAQDVNIDLFQPLTALIQQIEDATGATILGTRYGSWETTSSSWSRVALGGGWLDDITTTNQRRNAVNIRAIPLTQRFTIDPFVTDVSIQPYMNSRTVGFIATGLRPNTRVYAFFDGTPVFTSVAPAELNTDIGINFDAIYSAAFSSGKPENIVKRAAPCGTPLFTDANGSISGVFVIPPGKFKTGDREFLLIDQDSIVTGNEGTISRASGIFTASNIAVTKRGVNVTTTTPGYETKSWTENRVIVSVRRWCDPLGQSFRIEAPEEQSGVMITKMDLFFKSKSTTLGINVKICGMINGLPDPASILTSCSVSASDVKVSDNASLATTFVFDNPVFLNSNQDFAFYVSPDANNPDYTMWVSEIGGYDVTNGAQVFSNPYIGDLFRSSNAKSWIALPREDIKFNIYAANYQIIDGFATFNNEDDEYIKFDSFIQRITDKPILVNDEIRVIRSAVDPTIIDPTQKGTVQGIDLGNLLLTVDGSSGKLAVGQFLGVFRTPTAGANSGLTTENLIATLRISELLNAPIHSICPRFATAIPSGTFLGVQYKGTNRQGVKDKDWIELDLDSGKEMVDTERVVYSKSNETTLPSKSLSVGCIFKTSNKYISPVVDLVRKNALCIENIINDTSALKMEYTRQGTSYVRYISQRIVLADQQDAEDIKVFVSGYRPAGTEISVYIKFLAGDDTDLFVNKVWTKLDNKSPDLYSAVNLLEDFKEFEFAVPTVRQPVTAALPGIEYSAFLDSTNNNFLTYYAAQNDTFAVVSPKNKKDKVGIAPENKFVTFKAFAVKIVLSSESGIWCPKIDDVRAIALQA